MLDSLRSAARSWVAKVLLGLLVLSFAVWGIADIFTGVTPGSAIEVGETSISEQQIRSALDRELQDLTRQAGRPITLEQARLIGLDTQVVGRLVTEGVLDEAARRLGLGVSDEAIVRQITSDPSLRTPGGEFDRERFDQVLRSNGISEASFLAAERDATLRRQIAEGLVGEVAASQPLIEALHRYRTEQRGIAHVVLTAEALGPIPDPDQAALEAYFRENAQLFRAPELRKINVLTLDPEGLARSIQVTEEEARQTYDAQRARFTTPERRVVDQIVFPSAEEARAASDRIKAGTPFDAIATERNLKPADFALGSRTRSEILDPAVAEAAFALPANSMGEPVQGRFGTVLVRVGAVEAGSVRPFEEAREEIRRSMALDRASREVLEVQDRIEDERAGGASLADIAGRLNLPLRSFEAISREGTGPDGKPVEGAPGAAVLNAAFGGDVGVEIDPVQVERGFAWVDVEAVTPARERTLEEVREDALRRWRMQEVRNRLNELAGNLVREIEGGKPLETVASERGLPLQTAAPFRRTETPAPLSQAAVATVFAVSQGSAGQGTTADDAGRVVFRVTDVVAPPLQAGSPEAQALARQAEQQIANDLLAQYVGWLRDEIGVRINQPALARVLGQS